MEAIKTYIENMFSTLPHTEEIERLKEELLSNMEEKYLELKDEGKSENEAIGIVISEFGNIDELLNELDIEIPEERAENTLSKKTMLQYLEDKKRTSFLISIGVSLCIIGGAMLILTNQLIESAIILRGFSERVSDIVPLMPLFILILPAIALFIYSGQIMEKYNAIEKGDFSITSDSKIYLENKLKENHSKFTAFTITGVSLCIASPFCIFLGSAISDEASTYGLVALMFIITVAVYIFINSSSLQDPYKKLLQLGEYNMVQIKNNKVIGAVAAVVWPIAVCIFLLLGFIFGLWRISWVVFPITGILFGGFAAFYNVTHNESKND
ncbi:MULTISPECIES: permease prefix domain 1-containing protein [Clostridium]|uniref:Uncharacterized protein n=1 Tax=Clostridium cadaveris TaxID=1529 RepID=A0A1I2PCZ5_9CLOT|nr:permease prefix domain 1-containing protein [Clostridium cadaveris]MDU4953064.1 permease prefix domain 1-containing protein [Clostridium sp.]MDM8312943.1 permease prefix domain 1-containing protein [Clostridium cadaveris]NME65784.1 hypothetical protein [Clostridium cadaveris]PWL55583.1 MAG: hypothetical protein DBY38_01255 [Clostridium cadaveris]SFG11536.1 hypothetical protein SAMN04487885_12645 [Clostridium cadaveris]